MNTSHFYSRYARLICYAVLLLMPLLWYGAIRAFLSNTNNVLDWLPRGSEETQRLFQFVGRFGSDEILVISWLGCSLDDERLDQVAAQLVEPRNDSSAGKPTPWFHKVYTGRETLAELTGEPLQLSRDEATGRMRAWLVGPDGQTTCALALISEPGSYDRAGAIRYVYQTLESAGIDAADAHLGGPTANAVAIDQASNRWIAEMGIGSALVGLLVAWKCLTSFRLVLFVMLSAVFAWGASLSCVFFSGTNMDAVLLVMPPLVFVLTVSGAIHLTNYFHDSQSRNTPGRESVIHAIRKGWLPCLLAALTTAIGLGSLLASQLVPVRKFGFFSSVSMLFIVVALLVVWPALLVHWPMGSRTSDVSRRRARWWWPLYLVSTRYANWWLGLFFLTLPLFGYGIVQLRTSAQLQDLLRPGSAAIQSYDWLRSHVGALTPVEVVLNFEREPHDDAKTMLARAELVEQLREAIQQTPEVDGTIAATTFAPVLPTGRSARDLMARRVIATRLYKHRARYEQLNFLHTSNETEHWRISTRVNSRNLEYGKILQRLKQQIETFLESTAPADVPVSVDVTGGVPLIAMTQQQLLKDLVRSFLIAFVLVALTMSVLLRSARAGLFSMIPNTLPALAAFGIMGLAGTTVDIGTMMTASAALGIAVDDTLHFLVWFRRGSERGGPPRRAVRFAYHHCATAMLQTSVVCGVGLLVFLASPFAPIARFGLVMAIMLGLALVGDLVLLPAVLCSSLGRSLTRRDLTSASQRPENSDIPPNRY